MTSLTRIAIATRKTIRYFIYFVIFAIILRVAIGMGISIYKSAFPEPTPPPTIAFGKLPRLQFPVKNDLPTLDITVETAEGGLPNLDNQTKVYYMPKQTSNLFVLDTAKERAAGLGFTSDPEQLEETVYQFKHDKVPSTLKLNIITGAFSVSYDLAEDPTPLDSRPPSPENALTRVKSFLSVGKELPEDLLEGPTNQQFLKTELQKLVPALSLSEANLVKISLFRKPINELPSLTIDPQNGNVWFLVSGEKDREKQIISGEYHYYPIDETQASTYPLKSTAQALEELKNGQGYIADLGQNKDGHVTVRKVYLAYLDPKEPVQYYQPIIVFEGDRGFVGYVSAVSNDYLQ